MLHVAHELRRVIRENAPTLCLLREGVGFLFFTLFLITYTATGAANKGGKHRPSSLAFFSTKQEVSYFVEAPGILVELQRIFPGKEIARVPALVIRGVVIPSEHTRQAGTGEHRRLDDNRTGKWLMNSERL